MISRLYSSLLEKAERRMRTKFLVTGELVKAWRDLFGKILHSKGIEVPFLPDPVGEMEIIGGSNKDLNVMMMKSNIVTFGTSGIPRTIPSAAALDMSSHHVIVVNDGWCKLRRQEKEGILAHELAHIKLGHTQDTKKTILSNLKRLLKQTPRLELEADELAVKCGHGTGLALALTVIKNEIQLLGGNSKELEERIPRIQRLVREQKEERRRIPTMGKILCKLGVKRPDGHGDAS